MSGSNHDRQRGLIRFGARDYDPYAGRWTARDSVLFAAGDPNLYRYTAGDPVNSIDPSGLDIWIEGPSGSEPAFHQSINIGNPFGEYSSFSFAINGGGTVYEDEDLGGEIQRYLRTTPAQDAQALRELLRQEAADNAQRYGPHNTCRNYSQDKFNQFKGMFGGQTTPPVRPVTGTSGWGILRYLTISGLSSTVTSIRL